MARLLHIGTYPYAVKLKLSACCTRNKTIPVSDTQGSVNLAVKLTPTPIC